MRKLSETFISYDHRDTEYVKKLAEEMTNVGLTPRIDFKFPYGANFFNYMDHATKSCSSTILVISNFYIKNDSWAHMELMEVLSRQLRGQMDVIPLILGDLKIEDLPFGIMTKKYIRDNECDPRNIKDDLKQLSNQIESDYGLYRQQIQQHRIDRSSNDSERRIRIQITPACDRVPQCPWCHGDEFDRRIAARPEKLSKLLENIQKSALQSPIYPGPKLEYTITGGEPLNNSAPLKQILATCPKNSFLVTNGIHLEQRIEDLNNSNIGSIRVSYPRRQDNSGALQQWDVDSVENGIAQLLKKTNIKVRFNHVLELNTDNFNDWVSEIERVIDEVEDKYHGYLGERIIGIAFIEPFNMNTDETLRREGNSSRIKKFPIFNVAKTCVSGNKARLYNQPHISPLPGERKMSFVRRHTRLKIEFVKVNCDMDNEIISRCLYCAVEKDICISADGRVRVCSGWNPDTFKPRYSYTHFNESSPLIGISSAIRRKYGIVCFYTHLPPLARIANNKLTPKQLTDLRDRISNVQQTPYDLTQLIRTAAEVIQPDSKYEQLFRERACSKEKISYTIELCSKLLQSAYFFVFLMQDHMDDRYRDELLISLLLLEYLSVDESLFSSARTILSQGIVTELLRCIVKDELVSQATYSDAMFCLGAISMENTDENDVLLLLDSLKRTNEKECPQKEYILGCLWRQKGKEGKARKHLSNAEHRALMGIEGKLSGLTNFKWLYPELLVESERSLGASYRSNPADSDKRQKIFLKAEKHAIQHDTKLRYHALFSDGYAILRDYFRNKDAVFALQAYSKLELSVVLNPSFYASLIRISILQVTMGMTDQAKMYLIQARASFSERGLLSDQEYLNSLLCEYTMAIADDGYVVDDIPDAKKEEVYKCQLVGDRDVECVRDDARILLQNSNCGGNGRKHHISKAIDSFVDECDKLLQTKRLNSMLRKFKMAVADNSYPIENIPDAAKEEVHKCQLVEERDVECVRDDAKILLQNSDNSDDGDEKRIRKAIESFVDECDRLLEAKRRVSTSRTQ
ncbi:MAG: toll/interleukin-1 receptor domain-containing protein [Deltaproteobacteria bacterium]|nr:toll/interleukin-1 receptor domain-containing protein [Deltaproteobacteria bacterium]